MVLQALKKMWNRTRKEILIYLICATALVIWGIIWYYKQQLNKGLNNDYKIEKEWAKYPPKITNINNTDATFGYKLRDYYIASSYNSCCGGDFQDDYVSLIPLKQVIFQGARVLDFEIYFVNQLPVVAAGPTSSVYVKGTYNSIPIGGALGALAAVKRYAFNHASCPNPEDPLFLHFRIKSDRTEVYAPMAKAIKETFAGMLLDADYGYEGRPGGSSPSKNLAIVPLLSLQGKVIIICDQASNSYRGTPLEELINLSSGSPYFQEQRNYDVQYTHDPEGLIEYNKKNMTLTMPDLSALNNNSPAQLHMSYGCQMVAMNYPNLGSNMKYYFDQFNTAGSAFVLKPAKLRYIPVVINLPDKQTPLVSYAPRSIDMPMYQTSI